MGKLLSSAIQMQNGGGAANPTLVIDFTDFAGGANCDVYKNATYYATVVSGVQLTVPIVAGNTFYLSISSIPDGFISATYYINGVSQGTQSANLGFTLDTIERTASGTNAYSYAVIADFF